MKKNKKTSIWILAFSLVLLVSFSAIPQDVKASEWNKAWGQVRLNHNFGWPWGRRSLGTHNIVVLYTIGEHYGMPYISSYHVADNAFSDNPYAGGIYTLTWEDTDYDEFYSGASLIAVTITFTSKIYNVLDTNHWTRYDFSVSIMADTLPNRYSYTLYQASIDDHIPGTTNYDVYGVTVSGNDPVFLYTILPS